MEWNNIFIPVSWNKYDDIIVSPNTINSLQKYIPFFIFLYSSNAY